MSLRGLRALLAKPHPFARILRATAHLGQPGFSGIQPSKSCAAKNRSEGLSHSQAKRMSWVK
jgi:hypothetical protein